MHTDVTQERDVEAAVAFAVDTFGGSIACSTTPAIPVRSAGSKTSTWPMFDRTVAIHLRGVFLGIRAAARVMKPQGHGSIINTSSVAGLAANYAGHDYSACKAAIAHLTRTTANELGEHGVRVNAICPGGIATSIFARAAGLEGDAAQRTVEFMSAALGDMAPIRRAGQPLDIAEAALWLASDASSFVNGQAIAVDGGLTTGPLYRDQHAKIEGLLQLLQAPRS